MSANVTVLTKQSGQAVRAQPPRSADEPDAGKQVDGPRIAASLHAGTPFAAHALKLDPLVEFCARAVGRF